jgi:peroxiredoxin
MPQVKIDRNAPGFMLRDFDGKVFSLSDNEGKYIVVLIFNRGFT